MTDPVATFRDLARRHDRMFWLDGGGSREWSGRRSLLGALGPDDVSLTYDAARREVRRHVGAGSTVVGEDVFEALEDAVAADDGDPSVHWVGYLGYACRPDLPARTGGSAPDAVWMRVRDPLVLTHPAGREADAVRVGLAPTTEVPGWYDAAFASVQEQLHAGNTYEVNLTYRE
ncbi:MAG: anthranilate synthase component I family protein, partial [Nocardioides sp.]